MTRNYFPGMGTAVADRTINRPGETWGDVANRVALGNVLLDKYASTSEYNNLNHHLSQASILLSGRHLQHGDRNQPSRPQEVFTNCGSYETKVITLEKGVVAMGEVVGENLTVRAADGSWQSATFNAHGSQDLYRLTFHRVDVGGNQNASRVVRFTRNHRWLLKDGTFTDNITVGDRLAVLPVHKTYDPIAVVHGLVFGDGSAHKGRRDHGRPGVSMGRTYASIRVCKQDAVRDEIQMILDKAGYNFTTPPHADGDRVYYIGKLAYAKELPFTRDPDYLAGFIYGWWLADGHKTEPSGTTTISTCDKIAAEWLIEHAPYVGLTPVSLTLKDRKEGDGSFTNGKALNIVRLRKGVEWKLASIEYDAHEEVFCPEEPVTSTFTLANGIVTGNCSTALLRFLNKKLLLSGSGVGGAYDDDLMVIDWAKNLPTVICVIDNAHEDVSSGRIKGYMTPREAKHFYRDSQVLHHVVDDSREGWAKAVELIERLTFEATNQDLTVLLDFSVVRPFGRPIAGMQNRPASGPGPLMGALTALARIRHSGMPPWKAAMYADHLLAECVLVGGARRAARIAIKYWKDASIFDFIQIKRPSEYAGKTRAEVEEMRSAGGYFESFLWSSNNSVAVDAEFWERVSRMRSEIVTDTFSEIDPLDLHAYKVWQMVMDCQFGDGTGEPGFLNVDKLEAIDDDIEDYLEFSFVGSNLYQVDEQSREMLFELVKRVLAHPYHYIVNPCGEITLFLLGGFCVIGDVVPYHASSDEDACDAFRAATRALIRVNLMDSIYRAEVMRTNRIGVSITGLHEYMWDRFGLGFRDAIAEGPIGPLGITEEAKPFWEMLSTFAKVVEDAAIDYAIELDMVVPHTMRTIKPAGTTSKLFGLTEGAHLPSMRKLLRWVQFRNDDPLVEQYKLKGYPTRKLVSYNGTTIVGFPTAPVITTLGMGDKLVTAAEATIEEQFRWLRLLEHYWIGEDYGNQISYTLKYDPDSVDFPTFEQLMFDNVKTVKAVSVMPQMKSVAYEYQPEEPVTDEEYEIYLMGISETMEEDVDRVHVDCATGACPITWAKEDDVAEENAI